MKKTFMFLFLIFCFMFLLVGCFEDIKLPDGSDDGTSDNGGDNNGSGSQGGQGQGDGNKDSVKSRDEVANLIGDKYLITIKVDSSYKDSSGQTVEEYVEYTTLSDGEYSYWGTSVDDLSKGSLYRRCDDTSLVAYDYDKDAEGYYEMVVFPTEINPFRSVNAIFLVESEIEYTTKTSTTFLGRACTKYEYKDSEASLAGTATYERTWFVDDATGACLKYSAAVSGSGLGYSGGASANFEVTQFEQGSKVDETIKKITDKIFIKEWDEEFFGKLGLVEAGGASFKLDKILKEANVEKSKLQLREADNEVNETTGTYSVQYFAALSQSEGEELVKKIITNIFNCGAKYDSDGTSYENPLAEPLCYIDSDGNLSYSFTATPGAGDPYVEVRGEWNPYINNGVWNIELAIYYNK